MKAWAIVLVVSAVVAVLGVLALTQATMGVGLIGVACFGGIVARIMQARER